MNYTINLVAAINGISRKSLDDKRLMNTSQAMEYEVEKVFDANDGEINAYNIAVWRHEYPNLKYNG